MVEVVSLSRRYGSVQALRDVSFHVEKGHIMGLLGQNGAGKTTLLKILTGYLAPTKGRVSLCGFDPLMQPMEARRNLGYLPETPPLCDEMTVWEYLCFVAELRGVEGGSIARHVRQVMELCGIDSMRSRLIAHLSKGYRQRTGIAQALCGSPSVLVLDEPTVGLDPVQITEMRSLIRSLGREHTIVFSSHILSEVQLLCDQVVILHQGRLCLDTGSAAFQKDSMVTLRCALGRIDGNVLNQLRQMKHLQSLEQLPSTQEQASLLLRFDGEKEPERQLFSLLCRLNVPLLHLSREGNSLEDVFLSAISAS